MKTIIRSAVVVSAVSLLAACGSEDKHNSDSSVQHNYHDITTTLQGTVFNAIDGARITDKSLSITLVQGSNYRRAKVRKGTADFAGDYAIGNIPTSTALSRPDTPEEDSRAEAEPAAPRGNITYRVSGKVDGFQDFDAAVSFDVQTNDLQDRRANVIGNIYMYPKGVFASDVKVNVSFSEDNEVVVGATVLLNPRTGSNVITTDLDNKIDATNGYQGSLQAVTDASGTATFAAADLVLGGSYNIDVLPIAHKGTQLAVNRGTEDYFTVGATTDIRNVSMAEVVPGNDNGLYITSASNTDTDALTPTGVLTLGFSRAVTLVDERNVRATLSGTTVRAELNSDSFPNSTVEAVLSTDGLTLTLTPVFTKAPVAFNDLNNEALADNNLVVTYSSLLVRIADAADSANTYSVFTTLNDGTGDNPEGKVKITKSF